jgi:hypothetical protein
MSLERIISLGVLAAIAGTPLMPNAAEAGMRICLPFLICPHTPPREAAPAPKGSEAVVEKKAVSSTGKKTASAATAISCDKAGEIVSGYGFANVTPTTCTGQVFAFNATRSANTYVIKLSSASGELTEVNKVQ